MIVDKRSDFAISIRGLETGGVMFYIKKILSLLGILALVFLICGVWVELSAAPRKHVIIIDPAHGGQDTGIKLTYKVDEKDITLAVAMALRKELAEEKNLEIILTRDSDKEVSLEDRKKNIAEIKPDILISLHTNAGFDKSASGFELYCPEFNKDIKEKSTSEDIELRGGKKSFNDSVKMARMIQANLNTLFPRKGRGLRRADLPVTDKLFVPTVVVEMGFATNSEDKKKLLSPDSQKEIAKALAKSIKTFFR